MRARLLLAEVAAHDLDGKRALSLAQECSAYFEEHKAEATDWDRAFASLELAYAHAVSGNQENVGPLLDKATQRGEQLPEKADRDFFSESLARISKLIEAL